MISVLQLARIDYATALELQRSLVELRKRGEIGDVLLLLEHTPVITLGRNAKTENVLASREQLAARGVEVFECDRGGDVTYHGPGQLVGYPIFDLRGFATPEGPRKTLGAVEFVRRLEEVLIRTCADFGIAARRVSGRTGVWTEQSDAKVAAIGVHISRGVTSHGFALNVSTDLDAFQLIVPCGIADKAVTSLGRELGEAPTLEKVAESAARNFGAVFQSQVLWVENLEALLGRRIGVPMKPPTELRKMHGEEETWA
ncbi:MAG TPA: lipoyl(octanoyl) transferase LipB [Terriglobales bacterium]|nr:lipoyl(octanoyl) transferase LipB [Terriglobales bacterium]